MQGHGIIRSLALASAFLLPASMVSAADKVKVTYASADAFYSPYFVAIDKGYFSQLGLDVELVQAGGGTATPALMSGSVQFSSSSGSAVSAILKGAPLKVVMTLAVTLPWKMWATNPNVKSLQDLKGLPVGVETRGGLDELAARAALLKAGLPQDWVIYSPLGVGGTQRFAALQSGSMPVTFLTDLQERMARTNGVLKNAHVLVDFADGIQFPYNGLATSQDVINKSPSIVERFVRGVLMGVRATKTEPETTLRILQKYAKGAPLELLTESLKETAPIILDSGETSTTLRQFDLTLRTAMLGMPEDSGPPVDKVYDYSFVAKARAELEASGWKPTE